MDSMCFINSGLGKVVETMHKGGEDFPLLRMCNLHEGSKEKFEILQQKLVFPYSAHSSLEAMRRQEEYPTRQQFWDSLTEQDIEESEYQRGRRIWDTFGYDNVYQQLIQ